MSPFGLGRILAIRALTSEVNRLLEAVSRLEISPILAQWGSSKIELEDVGTFLYRSDKDYYINVRPTWFYGYVVFHDGTVVPSYPHLENFRGKFEKILPMNLYSEEKLNGTNIGICRIKNTVFVRTRMNPLSEKFPVSTFENTTINPLKPALKEHILALRREMFLKYSRFYEVIADGEHVFLTTKPLVQHILKEKYPSWTLPDGYMFFFELVGKINPVIVDAEMRYGLYDFDYDLVLLDILRLNSQEFVDRRTKEQLGQDLHIVRKLHDFSTTEDLVNSVSALRQLAAEQLMEGMVVKSSTGPVCKLKPQAILDAAYRGFAILKGHVLAEDLHKYVARGYEMFPNDFSTALEQSIIEAKTDYPEDVVTKNFASFKENTAVRFAVAEGVKIATETGLAGPQLFRFLNEELPKRADFLRVWWTENEDRLTGADKRAAKMMRMRILQPVVNHFLTKR